MKAYIISIIGAALTAAFADMLSPDKWRKYVQMITGIVIISCIIAPLKGIFSEDLFGGFGDFRSSETEGGEIQRALVVDELTKRIEADIAERLRKEFNISVTAEVEINVNDNNEIEGVERIRLFGEGVDNRVENRLKEVYGVREVEYE